MLGRGRVSRRRAGERGSELVEFALVFPLLLLVGVWISLGATRTG